MHTIGILFVLQCVVVLVKSSTSLDWQLAPQPHVLDQPPSDEPPTYVCLLKECRKWLTAIVPILSDTITDTQFDQLKQFISDISFSCKLGSGPPYSEVSLFTAGRQEFSPWLNSEDKLAQFFSKLAKADLIQIENAGFSPNDLFKQSLVLVNRHRGAKEGRYILLITDQDVNFDETNSKLIATKIGAVFQMIRLPNRQEDSNYVINSSTVVQSKLLGDSFNQYQSYNDVVASTRKFTACGQPDRPHDQLPRVIVEDAVDLRLQNQNSMQPNQGQLSPFNPPVPQPPLPPQPSPPQREGNNNRVEIFGMSITSVITTVIMVIVAFLLGYFFARAQMWRRMTIEARNRVAADNRINRDLELAIHSIDKIDNNINRNLNIQSSSAGS